MVIIMENAWAILESREGREPPFEEMKRYFKMKFPDWLPLAVVGLEGRFNGAPFKRKRCMIFQRLRRSRRPPPPPKKKKKKNKKKKKQTKN